MDIARQYVKQFLSESRKQTQKFEAEEDYFYAYTTPDLAEDGGWVTADSVEKLQEEWENNYEDYGLFNIKKVLVMKPATSVDKAMVLSSEANTGGDLIYPSIDQAINNPETGLYALGWKEGETLADVTEAEIQELLQTKDLARAREILEKIFVDEQDFGDFDGLYEYVSGMMPKANGMDPGKLLVKNGLKAKPVKRDYDYYVKKLKAGSMALEDVPEKFITPEMCKIEVEESGWALRAVPDKYITPELCKIAVEDNGDALRFVPEKFKTPELCKIAVENDGKSLEYVPDKYITPELCKIAVEEDHWALQEVPEKFKTSEMCRSAVERFGYALKFVPEKFKTLELCKIAVQGDNEALEFVPDNLKAQVEQELDLS